MHIMQTVQIPASHRLTIDVPREIPSGMVVIAYLSAKISAQASEKQPRTAVEALQMAMKRTADPNRKPISRLFGKHKGIFGGDGVAYQRAMRDEWDD